MKALRYARRLIEYNSVSHKSNRLVSRYLEAKLTKHGFVVEKLQYKDKQDVEKVCVVAKKGVGTGGLAYFGHSDVVPAKTWFSKKFGPFEPKVGRGRLYGRGSCDMKGSIAAMLAAAQQFSWDELKQPFYFVVTADEETGFDGAKFVVDESKQYREMVAGQTKAIIGEPTMLDVVHAHKGAYKIVAKSFGVAAHSGTAEGKNANLAMIPFLAEMKAIIDETENDSKWKNELFDPPTMSWNISFRDNARAMNVKASKSTCVIYLRTMPEVDVEPLLERARNCAESHEVAIKIYNYGEPFYASANSKFVEASLKLANRKTAKTVSYGTDGGFFTELEDKIVFGPGSIQQAHTHNEWISLEQLKLGTELYRKMIQHWCCS